MSVYSYYEAQISVRQKAAITTVQKSVGSCAKPPNKTADGTTCQLEVIISELGGILE